jgi:hypothetical protein
MGSSTRHKTILFCEYSFPFHLVVRGLAGDGFSARNLEADF